MEKADVGSRNDSSPETLTVSGNLDVEDSNENALTERQMLNPQPTDDPNDPVSNTAEDP